MERVYGKNSPEDYSSKANIPDDFKNIFMDFINTHNHYRRANKNIFEQKTD